MLNSLHIENYVLIDSLDIDFSEGFSVITGQTGAGKSILLGALGLVMGARADLKAISEGRDRCVIEAEFDISSLGLEDFFAQNELEYSPYCILRRELHRSGKSRVFLNDDPVSASTLKLLGDKLIDIHSQHNNLLIKDSAFQTQVLDSVAGNFDLLQEYKSCYKSLLTARRRLTEFKESIATAAADRDYIAHQYASLEAAALKAGEEESLETEMRQLENSGEISQCLAETVQALDGEPVGAIGLIKTAIDRLSRVEKYNPEYAELMQRLESCRIEVKDIAAEVSELCEKVDSDPARLEAVSTRFDLIYGLLQKHRVRTTEELLQIQTDYKQRLDNIENSEEQLSELEKELANAESMTAEAAAALSESRRAATNKLEAPIVEMLTALGMPNAVFKADVADCDFKADGANEITFLFSANKQNSPRAVAQTASGGEVSRIMLCIKAILAESSKLPTLIFDEIDTGVSGAVAAKMGQIMKEMSRHTQIICITHLPQVAAQGDRHYKVYKTDDLESNNTHVSLLDQAERVEEIAKMLSGDNVSQAAITNAQDLLGMQ